MSAKIDHKSLKEQFIYPLIVALLSGLMLWYLTSPKDISLRVRVEDASTRQPVAAATVILAFTSGGRLPVQETTNSSGTVRFRINPELEGMPAVLYVAASDYYANTRNISVTFERTPILVLLDKEAFLSTPPNVDPPLELGSQSEPEVEPTIPSNPSIGTILGEVLPGTNILVRRTYVPAGAFRMGRFEGEPDERPVHDVTISAFWIDPAEVTNEQFSAFLNANGNQENHDSPWIDLAGLSSQIEIRDGIFQPKKRRGNHPVVMVNWYGASAFCEWARGRLPTEAEWEYAARETYDRLYPWGNFEPTCDLANFHPTSSAEPCNGGTQPVQSLPTETSWSGAYDMAGNVFEWVNDWYLDEYYSQNPEGGYLNPLGPTDGSQKVMRGGAWHSPETSLLTYRRDSLDPNSRDNGLGFRCVQSAD